MVAGGRELIDTLWNVNYAVNQKDVRKNAELIETLWNVNISISSTFKSGASRINRNIVECK